MKRILATTAIAALFAAPALAQTGVETDTGADAEIGADVGAETGVDTQTQVDVDTGVDTGIAPEPGADAQTGVDTQVGVGTQTQVDAAPGAGVDITAEELMGAAIYDAEENNIGSVTDVITDPEGAPVQIVTRMGGFLGIGARTVAIDLANAEIDTDANGDVMVRLEMTGEELENLPDFQG